MQETGTPGPVVLLGGGETSSAGGAIFESVLRRTGRTASPRIAVLETPAGFEPNSARVAGRVAEFLRRRLTPFSPVVDVVAARRRGTPFTPDSPDAAERVLRSDAVFLGPGSPTYAVRQLRGSAAWHAVTARHFLGGITVLASAAVVAAGAEALPVYEIFKAGDDPHWREGLDLLGVHGLPLVLVPHWDNADGGAEFDSSRCYLGRERFDALLPLLPPGRTVAGVDEGTALVVDVASGKGEVLGAGRVTLLRGGEERILSPSGPFPLSALGPFRPCAGPGPVPADLWEAALAHLSPPAPEPPPVPPGVRRLVEEREEARTRRDWHAADALRRRILAEGWEVTDTPGGPSMKPSTT